MVMITHGRNPAAQTGLTIAYQGGPPDQNPKDLTCDFPYQTLPDPVLAVRTPLVILVWSTNCYHRADLGLNLPCITFTNHYHRGEGQGTDRSVVGGVVATGAVGRRVIAVDNDHTAWHSVENRTHTQTGSHGGGGYRKENFEIIRPVGL